MDTISIGEQLQQIEAEVEALVESVDTERRVTEFPEPYIDDYSGEVQYLRYEWQTSRSPVDADIQGNDQDGFTVQAGRTDTITDPAMYSEDRKARKLRAEYIFNAVDDQNVNSGDQMMIPIPRTDAGVKEVLADLKDDRRVLESTDRDSIEAAFDPLIYDLFDLTDDDREVIEGYLEVF